MKKGSNTTLIAAVLSAALAGGSVYAWQQVEIKSLRAQYEKTDEEKILAAARAYTTAAVDFSASYRLGRVQGSFATVSVEKVKNGSGFVLYLKEVDEIWVVIASAQNPLSAETREAYGIPDSL